MTHEPGHETFVPNNPFGNNESDSNENLTFAAFDPQTGNPVYLDADGAVRVWQPSTPGITVPGPWDITLGGSPGQAVEASPEIIARTFAEESNVSGGLTEYQRQTLNQRVAEAAEQTRQFNETLEQDAEQFEATNERLLQQLAQQYDLSEQELAQAREFFDARAQQGADQFNTEMAVTVAIENSRLQAQQASLQEQIRQFNQQDARAQEQLQFALLREQVAVEEGNRTAKQNATQIVSNIQNQISTLELNRQNAITEVKSINAQIQNNTAQFNAMEKARVEQLNEERRQANLDDLRANAELIGTLAQNPADAGKLAAILRAGGGGAISQAIAEGNNAITDESIAPLRGALGAQGELLQGPTLATPNLIDPSLVDLPEFNTPLPTAPTVEDLFTAVNFDPNAVQISPTQQAGDISQFFSGISAPDEVSPALLGTSAGAATGTSSTPVAPATSQTSVDPGLQNFIDATAAAGAGDVNVGASALADPEALAKFFEGFEHGGMAPPGMPVRVGDSSDGKENEEIAMVDAMGNLIVHPIDKLPKAENGGLFQTKTSTLSRDGASSLPSLTGGQVDLGFTYNPYASAVQMPQTTADPNARQLFGTTTDQTQPTPLVNPGFNGDWTFGDQTAQVSPQNVAQTAQNPAVGTGQIPLASKSDTYDFLGAVQQDALRRGGFARPSDISPLKVSAPGTSNFLQQLSASTAGVFGYGPSSLFFEELAKLTPRGVRQGLARRTA